MKSRKTKKSFLAKHDPNRQNGRCLLSLLKNTVGTILWAVARFNFNKKIYSLLFPTSQLK